MRTPLQTATAIVHAGEDIEQLAIDLKQAMWSQSATEESRVLVAAATTAPTVRKELRKGTHWTPPTLPESTGLLDVNGCIPENVIMDTGAVAPMITPTKNGLHRLFLRLWNDTFTHTY